jgi:hypothetical protein
MNSLYRVEVIYFSECAFMIGDLDCMTLLGTVHILCIIASEFRLIDTKVLEPYETSMLHGLENLYLMRH